ncbi:hypothetical protein [Actinoplanes lobatus]|nr:hypothetical protein [Actinoplanes lobatus]MBB4752506.1 hypothetical protein [Actinoplanes lobatus]
MREQPLPDFGGITGWTKARIAVHTPGRSTTTIAKALRRLADTGRAELIGDDPERYRPFPA